MKKIIQSLFFYEDYGDKYEFKLKQKSAKFISIILFLASILVAIVEYRFIDITQICALSFVAMIGMLGLYLSRSAAVVSSAYFLLPAVLVILLILTMSDRFYFSSVNFYLPCLAVLAVYFLGIKRSIPMMVLILGYVLFIFQHFQQRSLSSNDLLIPLPLISDYYIDISLGMLCAFIASSIFSISKSGVINRFVQEKNRVAEGYSKLRKAHVELVNDARIGAKKEFAKRTICAIQYSITQIQTGIDDIALDLSKLLQIKHRKLGEIRSELLVLDIANRERFVCNNSISDIERARIIEDKIALIYRNIDSVIKSFDELTPSSKRVSVAKAVNLKEFVDDAFSTYQTINSEGKGRFINSVGDGIIVFTSEWKLMDIIHILIESAQIASNEKSLDLVVKISAKSLCGNITLCIEDNGPPVLKREEQRLFYQGEKSSRDLTGFALHTAANFALEINAKLRLERSNISETIFSIEFPDYEKTI